MSDTVTCPVCTMDDILAAPDHYECATCGHEWPKEADGAAAGPRVVLDANGNALESGDTVVLVKDLKLKGSSTTIKGGTKVKGIRIVDEGDHELDCKVDGMKIMLKACFVKKA